MYGHRWTVTHATKILWRCSSFGGGPHGLWPEGIGSTGRSGFPTRFPTDESPPHDATPCGSHFPTDGSNCAPSLLVGISILLFARLDRIGTGGRRGQDGRCLGGGPHGLAELARPRAQRRFAREGTGRPLVARGRKRPLEAGPTWADVRRPSACGASSTRSCATIPIPTSRGKKSSASTPPRARRCGKTSLTSSCRTCRPRASAGRASSAIPRRATSLPWASAAFSSASTARPGKTIWEHSLVGRARHHQRFRRTRRLSGHLRQPGLCQLGFRRLGRQGAARTADHRLRQAQRRPRLVLGHAAASRKTFRTACRSRRWSTASPCWSSPRATDRSTAFEPRTGKQLWSYNASARGIQGTPLVVKNHVFLGQAEENRDDSTMGAFFSVDAAKRGDLVKSGELWRKKEITVDKSSAIPVDGKVVVVDSGGYLHVVNPDDGRFSERRQRKKTRHGDLRQPPVCRRENLRLHAERHLVHAEAQRQERRRALPHAAFGRRGECLAHRLARADLSAACQRALLHRPAQPRTASDSAARAAERDAGRERSQTRTGGSRSRASRCCCPRVRRTFRCGSTTRTASTCGWPMPTR